MADDNLVIGLALVAVIVSAVGLGFSYYNQAGITGFAQYNDTGIVNITIDANLAIRFVSPTYDIIDWGNGTVDTGSPFAILETPGGTVTNGSWIPVAHGFIIENIGNIPANLSVVVENNASDLLGGDNPVYQFNWTENESGSCHNGSMANSTWFDVNKTVKGSLLCQTFLTDDATDEVRLDVRLYVPSNSYTGTRTDTVTAIADTDW